MKYSGKGLKEFIRDIESEVFFFLFRLLSTDVLDQTKELRDNLIERLKHRQTFVKFKSNGRTYSRIYFLNSSDDIVLYLGSRYKLKREACMTNFTFCLYSFVCFLRSY
jgi:hypothetical protein